MRREGVSARVRKVLEGITESDLHDFADGDHVLRTRLLDSAGFLDFLVRLEIEFSVEVLDHPEFMPESLATIEEITSWLTRYGTST
jgi:acyl carrier protein